MFIQISKNKSIRKRDIIGVFDLDTSTVSQVTRKFLSQVRKEGKEAGVNNLPKAFVLTDNLIYLSPHTAKYLSSMQIGIT